MNYIRGRALPCSICWVGCWQCAVLAQTSEFGPDVLAEQSSVIDKTSSVQDLKSRHDQLEGRQSLLMLSWTLLLVGLRRTKSGAPHIAVPISFLRRDLRPTLPKSEIQ